MVGSGQVRPHRKMIRHKEPENGEGYPIHVYGELFRPREQQVQRHWGWKAPSTLGKQQGGPGAEADSEGRPGEEDDHV